MSPEDLSLALVERKHILAVLRLCHGNRTRTARMLGISVRCLRNKLREYRAAGIPIPHDGPTDSLYLEIGTLLGSFASGFAERGR